MSLAREFKPGAITLDINLPDMAGWTILDRLKHDPATRHIPVHIISGDENRRRGLALGAMTYLEKSVTKDSLAEAFATIEHSAQKRVKKLLWCVGRTANGDAMLEPRGRARTWRSSSRNRRRSAGRRGAAVSRWDRDSSRSRTISRRCNWWKRFRAQSGAARAARSSCMATAPLDAKRRSWTCARWHAHQRREARAIHGTSAGRYRCCCCIARRPI